MFHVFTRSTINIVTVPFKHPLTAFEPMHPRDFDTPSKCPTQNVKLAAIHPIAITRLDTLNGLVSANSNGLYNAHRHGEPIDSTERTRLTHGKVCCAWLTATFRRKPTLPFLDED